MFPRCDDQSLKKLQRVVDLAPKFPFSHYALAFCLYERGDNRWRHHARKAIEIFYFTTMIDGHHINHEESLKLLQSLLGDQSE